jgi:hypothetical protein
MGRDDGGDAKRRQVRGMVAGREGRHNEEAVVGGGEAEAEAGRNRPIRPRVLWRDREERHMWWGGVEASKGCSKVETRRDGA